MPKKRKSNKTNPKKSFRTAKVSAREGSNVSYNITRNNKEQKHAPERSCKKRARNSGNLEISKSKKLAKNTESIKLIKRFWRIIKRIRQSQIMRKLLIIYLTLTVMIYVGKVLFQVPL